ncbi:hypothetical protein C8Q79DRAFT_1005557 [Trametes meyenii]|nr:hypothetical protein C8Q79DRAFT_1005557 [Trametes meyenii]
MSSRSICDTLVPAKRPASPVSEPLRVSRSMAAEDLYGKNLLIEQSPLPVATSTRRRVNPESLAVRLGPELVKELESHVKPGAIEMPSFAIRQQIQMRFKVDRRHIYDWFHSKGLRVTKEDKRATVEQKTDAMRMQRRIRRCIAPAVPSARACPSLVDTGTDSAPSSPDLLTPSMVSSEFYPIVVMPGGEVVPEAHLDQSEAVACLPGTVDPATLSGDVRFKETLSAHHVLYLMSSTLAAPRPPPGYSRKFRDSHIESVIPLDETATLNQAQRENYYDTLSRVLGPIDGVQECVGTYKAHMARQLEIYYEDFLPRHTAPAFDDFWATSGPITQQEQPTAVSSELATVADLMSTDFESTGLWDALSIALELPSCVSAVATSGSGDASNFNSGSSRSLGLDDILASSAQERDDLHIKTATFAAEHKLSQQPSFGYLTPPIRPFFDSSSSSLAGALGEVSTSHIHAPDLDTRRKSKEWLQTHRSHPVSAMPIAPIHPQSFFNQLRYISKLHPSFHPLFIIFMSFKHLRS